MAMFWWLGYLASLAVACQDYCDFQSYSSGESNTIPGERYWASVEVWVQEQLNVRRNSTAKISKIGWAVRGQQVE